MKALFRQKQLLGKGQMGGLCSQDPGETCKHWEGTGMGQAGAWRANLFLPQHLTLSCPCQPSGHGCHCFCCLSMEKRFPPQTLELCLSQHRSSFTPLRAQLSLNLPWHPQGTGKKNFCLVCGCKAPSTTTETFFNLTAL